MILTNDHNHTLNQYLQEAEQLLRTSHTVIPKSSPLNVYHHCGVDKVFETGAVFINVVNRDYCKSLVVMLPGQAYPNHYHKIKTESFYILYGSLTVVVDGVPHELEPGELLHINRGEDHLFYTNSGAVFEEISTKYVPNDSVYLDEKIRRTSYETRRTTLNTDIWKEENKNA